MAAGRVSGLCGHESVVSPHCVLHSGSESQLSAPGPPRTGRQWHYRKENKAGLGPWSWEQGSSDAPSGDCGDAHGGPEPLDNTERLWCSQVPDKSHEGARGQNHPQAQPGLSLGMLGQEPWP